MSHLAGLQAACVASLIALIVLGIVWEGMAAPLRSGGSWLILKVVPLLFPLFGLLRGKRYTFQWSAMFILFYFVEGVVRAWSDKGLSAVFALVEVVLTVIFFIAAILYARYASSAGGRRNL